MRKKFGSYRVKEAYYHYLNIMKSSLKHRIIEIDAKDKRIFGLSV